MDRRALRAPGEAVSGRARNQQKVAETGERLSDTWEIERRGDPFLTNELDHILFYGTLCARETNHVRLGLPEALEFLGERTVLGTLYDLGEYPGLVLGGGATTAELYRIADRSILSLIDRFEGYDARRVKQSPFLRVPVSVPRHARSSSSLLDAWIYAFNGPVDGRPRILEASWAEYRRRRDASASVRLDP